MTSKKLALNRRFFDERWSKHRCVTCMDYSIQVHFIFIITVVQLFTTMGYLTFG